MTGAQKTSVRLVDCAKTFPDGTRALEPTTIDIAGGETVVLLGPSGCGKTTMLRIIAGLEQPDAGGRILFNDEDVTSIPIERRNVGMVFQSYALFPNMSVADNIAYGLRVRRQTASEISGRVAEMMDMMDIADLAGRRIDQLSGGQRQRVALARAIAVQPRILLLDEPLTALDALLRERLRVEIDGLLRGLGITAIYVTHDQSEALALGDRIFVMSRGQIAQTGSPREIYHAPANDFVADFVGTVNRLKARAGKDSIILGGQPIPAHETGAREGADVEILFRPEDAEVVEAGQGHLSGRVEASMFLGARTRIVVAVGDGATVIVDSSGRATFDIGQEIGIRLRPDDIRVN